MHRKIELLVLEREGGRRALASPEVGRFTCALERGSLVWGGASAGRIRTLGETVELVVPAGVTGRVTNERPERVHQPVGWGDVLYELAPLALEGEAAERVEASADAGGTVFRAPHSGRFWHRPAPKEPPFVEAGSELVPGTVVGMIEVMKTFTRLTYRPAGTLPDRARVLQVLVTDGAEVAEGDPLLELEPR